MELFKIICVTCRARLSVRDESLVGQIVACPRCNSMVEVVPPAEQTPAAVGTTPPEFFESPAPAEMQSAPEEFAAAPTEPTAEAGPMSAAASATKAKIIAWSVASFLVGATLAGSYLIFGSKSQPSPSVANEAEIAESSPQDSIEEPSAADTSTAVSPPENASAFLPIDSSETADDETAGSEQAAQEPELPTLPEEPRSQSQAGEITSRENSAEHETSESEPVAEQESLQPVQAEEQSADADARSKPTLRIDPLDFDPQRLDLASLRDQTTEPETEALRTESLEGLPGNEPLEEDPEVPERDPRVGLLDKVRLGEEAGSETSVSQVSEQLKLELPELRVQGMPLVDFLSLVGELAAVPVSVAPEELLMAGISPRREISWDGQEKTLARALEEVLQPIRLEYHVEDNQVIVRRQQRDRRRQIDYPVDDLTSANTTIEELAQLVQQFVMPESWQPAGGTGTLEPGSGKLRIQHTQEVHYQVLLFLERWRLARGLLPRSRYPMDRLAPTAPLHQIAEKLTAPATFSFTRFTPLGEVFRYWQQELQTPILVDWPALAEEGLSLRSTVACSVDGKPWHEALDEVLAPLGLGWRAAFDGAIVISAQQALHENLHWEIYPLQKELGSSDRPLLNELQATAKQYAETHGINNTAMHYPTESNVLMLRQPPAMEWEVYRQLRGREFLAE